MKRGDLLGAVVFFLFGAVTAILSLRMPIGTLRAAGSGLFPLCLGILLMVLSSLVIVKLFWDASRHADKAVSAIKKPDSSFPVVAFLTIMAFAVLFLNTIGYALDSFLLMLGLLVVLGPRRWRLNVALSLLTAAGSYLLFVHVLKIPLPRGFLGI